MFSPQKNIDDMNYDELRAFVKSFYNVFTRFKREYLDTLENLDDNNFSGQFIKKQDDMKTAIRITAEGIETKVSREDLDSTLENYSTITQTAEAIETEVKTLSDADAELSSRITQTSNSISAVIEGQYTDDMFRNYFTGIEITPHNIKMVDDGMYSIYNSEGLRFYDRTNQIEGWAIEPDTLCGGVLNYYKNNSACYRFGTGEYGTEYNTSDLSIKALNTSVSRFVVDVTNSGYKEIKFVGLAEDSSTGPYIYANGELLATQTWVRENAGSGGAVVAVFG